ncbi:MAG: hypothetical protein HYX47_05035 [Burkholderiales bacterium]|nr:hypothetical protein [Burkholderiales bacterium]
MDIVTAVADTDGGAHVDPGLSSLYEAFRSGRLLGMKAVSIGSGQIRMTLPILESKTPSTVDADNGEGLLKSPQYPCVRTITHELLLTLEKYAPWSFSVRYQATAAY